MANNELIRRIVPLSKVVRAAIVDAYEDLGRAEQMYSHWAARGLQKLQQETLKHGRKYMLLRVNHNTNTATLPIDFGGLIFLGYINERGKKVSLAVDADIPNVTATEEEPKDLCDVCGSNRMVCEELSRSQSVNLIRINGQVYEELVTKTLYPNGSYYLEKQTPFWNVDKGIIQTHTSREFISQFSLKPCGCLEDNEENQINLQANCPDVYGYYYADCCGERPEYGKCKIFEETGLIAFSPDFDLDFVYIEYWGFLPKLNGQYQVPLVAFETLVEYVKYKSVSNKRSVPLSERNWYLENYKRERRNMEKTTARFSLAQIISAIGLTPRYPINSSSHYSCFRQQPQNTAINTQTPTAQNVVRTVERQIVQQTLPDKIEFTVDSNSSPIINGQLVLTIPVQYPLDKSVAVVRGGSELYETSDYGVAYGVDGITITFVNAVVTGQKFKISWLKTVTL